MPNQPPLGDLPAYRGSNRAQRLNELTAEFNSLLAKELALLEQQLTLNIYPVDVYDVINTIVTDPITFGLSNVTQPAITKGSIVPNPEQFLYWDEHHFTTAFHRQLAFEAAAAVPASFEALIAGLIGTAICRRRIWPRSQAGYTNFV